VKNPDTWRPTKFELRGQTWRTSRNATDVGHGSRLITDRVARLYGEQLPRHARGRLLDLGCGKVPLYGAYRQWVSEITCVDWSPDAHIDVVCDLSKTLPFENGQFDTVVLSDVLEHIPEPDLLWSEMTRVLSIGGKVIMNVPFLYWIHAHPHDYYRYTSFALQRFVDRNGLVLVEFQPLGGAVEVLADLLSKLFAKLPVVGVPAALGIQGIAGIIGRTRWGARIGMTSAKHFPLGYFLVAQRVG
jgi:SAM-dependent methyltransferase